MYGELLLIQIVNDRFTFCLIQKNKQFQSKSFQSKSFGHRLMNYLKRTFALYSGSSLNGHSHKQRALRTATFTKLHFSQLPHKFLICTFSQAASSRYGHLFRVPKMSTYESFHCIQAPHSTQPRKDFAKNYHICPKILIQQSRKTTKHLVIIFKKKRSSFPAILP